MTTAGTSPRRSAGTTRETRPQEAPQHEGRSLALRSSWTAADRRLGDGGRACVFVAIVYGPLEWPPTCPGMTWPAPWGSRVRREFGSGSQEWRSLGHASYLR